MSEVILYVRDGDPKRSNAINFEADNVEYITKELKNSSTTQSKIVIHFKSGSLFNWVLPWDSNQTDVEEAFHNIINLVNSNKTQPDEPEERKKINLNGK